MARFRARNKQNDFWLDICYFEMYVRNADDTGWQQLLPNGEFFIRNGDNSRWMEVCCVSDEIDRCPDYADPYDPDNPIYPTPGDIIGPDGEIYGPGTPYTPTGTDDNYYPPTVGDPGGYYPPGYGGPGSPSGGPVIPDPGSPSGSSLGGGGPGGPFGGGGGPYTYIGGGGSGWGPYLTPTTTGEGSGLPGDPATCPVTVRSAGVNIMEMTHELRQVNGLGRIAYKVYSGYLELRVFHNGEQVATTGTEVDGAGELQFNYDVSKYGDAVVVVQAISILNAASEWTYQLLCPNPETIQYGTPVDPAPCHGVSIPTWGQGLGVQETYHNMGEDPGQVVIEYQFFNQPDRMDVFYRGDVVATTGAYVAGEGTLDFNYNPVAGVYDILIRVESASSGTSYVYRAFCPGQEGSSLNGKMCSGTNAVIGQGAGITDTWYDLSAESDGQVALKYNAFTVQDTFEVYQGTNLIATTNGDVSGEGQIGFIYDSNLDNMILTRVIGSTGDGETTWAFVLECPTDGPEVTIDADQGNYILPELDGSYQIFNAVVIADKPAIVESTVEWFVVYSGAADSSDLPSQSGIATLQPGEDEVIIPITVNSDYDAEPDETFSVQISNPVNCTIGAPDTVTFTIQNDDFNSNPDISVSATSSSTVVEGDSGDTTTIQANITMNQPNSSNVTVDWAVATGGTGNPASIGTAGQPGTDVISNSGTVTFNPGETLKQITLIVVGDDDLEGDEEFKVVISNASAGTIIQSEVVFTIQDNETPVIACNNATTSGGDGVTETYHELGNTAGTAVISYNMYTQPDQIDVFYEGNLIATSGGLVSGTGSFNINWNPNPGSTQIMVRMTGSSSGTAWDYFVQCPA